MSNVEINTILNSFNTLIYVVDANTYEVIYANDEAIKEFGDIINKTCYKALQDDKDEPCENCRFNIDDKNQILEKKFKWERKNSKTNKTYLYNDKITKWIDGRIVKVQMAIDITKQRAAEITSFEALSNATIEGIIIYDEDRRCVQVNKVASEIFGYTKEEMYGVKAFDLVSEESLELVKRVIQNKNQEPYEAILLRKDGTKFPAIIRGRDIILAGKKVRISAVMDITTIKEKEHEISKLAYFDPLTSLPNRISLKHKMDEFMNKSKRDSVYGALMFIDLDNFKIINDTKGHLIGDKLLIECARRLKKTVREYDFVSRFGGDEFLILIDSQTTDKEVAALHTSVIAEKIIEEMKKTFYVDKYEFKIGVSIGISIFKNHDITFNEILKYADSAMYHAKENQKGSYSFFDPKLQTQIERKVLLTHALRKAIEKKEGLEVFYQKQMNSDDDLVGIELLLRWNDKELGFISPAEFIPVSEESGLILKLGEYVLIEACELLKQWQDDESKKDCRISVNISLIQFQRNDFVGLIQNLVDKYNINKDTLRLEITESLLLKNADSALDKINKLKEMGVSVSIDDFGTGYSSLAYLKKLPVDELKIDMSFIRDILIDESDEIIVNTILGLGRKFNFEVIAEGVENKEILEKLKTMDCKYFQGYHYGKPSSIQELK